jgi:hypothetical protein
MLQKQWIVATFLDIAQPQVEVQSNWRFEP